MNAISLLVKSIAVSATLLVAASAHAQYRCDAPATSSDRRACEAAKQSPTALRHFIQRMRALESLQFSDYVKDAPRVARDSGEPSGRIATSTVDSIVR